MEQPAFALQHAREVVVEDLRIEFAGDAEARRVVEDGVERRVGQRRDLFGDVALSEVKRRPVRATRG